MPVIDFGLRVVRSQDAVVRLEPSRARRSTLAREPEVPMVQCAQRCAVVDDGSRLAASSSSDVVSLIDSEEPKPDSTMK